MGLQAKAVAISQCSGNNVITNRIEIEVNPLHVSQVRYALDGGSPQISSLFSNVSVGVHTVTITHLNGCVTDVTVNVINYSPLSVVTSTSSEITCNGANDATITLQVTGGTSSYTYTISPNTGVFDSVNNKFTGLSAGNYLVQVIDNQLGCVVERSYSFTEPTPLTIKAKAEAETCYQSNDGKVVFTISGGRMPYSYELKNIQGSVMTSTIGTTSTEVVITGLSPNTYVLSYVDKGGVCTKTQTLVVDVTPSIDPTNAIEVKYECATSSTTFTTAYIEFLFDDSTGALT